MKHSVKQRVLAAALLAGLCAMGGCKRVAAGSRHTEEATLPNAATHRVYAGRATLLLPNGVNLKITEAEVNEVLLRTEPGTDDFEKKWTARVNDIRNNHANPTGFSKVDREWPGDHTVQFDTTRGTLDARTWERWGLLGNTLVKATTVAPLNKADEAYKALADLFHALLPDGTPRPGDFRFAGGIARVPFNGVENVTAEWSESVTDAAGNSKAKLNFSMLLQVMDIAGNIQGVQQEMRQRLATTKQRGAMDGPAGVDVREVRSGPVTVHGMQGVESIVVFIDRPTGKQSFSARWECPGTSGDAYAPSIDLSASADNFSPADLPFLTAQWSAALQSLQFPRK